MEITPKPPENEPTTHEEAEEELAKVFKPTSPDPPPDPDYGGL